MAGPASIFVLSQLVCLSLPEVRKARLIVPALGSLATPSVVIFCVASHVSHRIEGRGSPPYTTPWPIHHPVVAVLLRECVVVPVVLVVTEVVGERGWHVDLPHKGLASQGRVLGSSFQQKNLVVRILGQPVCEHTSSTSSTDYHLVVFFGLPGRAGHAPSSDLGRSRNPLCGG